MPQQSVEQFQQFFLQLQLIVSTASRVKDAMERNDPAEVQRSLDDADASGIGQYILRMAIVQAGSEVQVLHKETRKWEADMDAKLSAVMHGQEQLMSAKKKLLSCESMLTAFQTGQNDKQKKVLMNFLSGNSKALLQSSFKAWSGYIKGMSEEVRIREEYQERIELAQKKLLEYKAANLKGARNIMKNKAENLEFGIKHEIFQHWYTDLVEMKRTPEDIKNIAELENKLKSVQKTQAENTKRVMARMTGDSNNALVSFCYQAWISFHQEYQKNKELEDQVKEEEKRVQAYLKSHGDSAKSIMIAASEASDTGLLSTFMTAWVKLFLEQKQEAEMCELLNGADSKFSMFGERSKNGGKSALDKAAYYADLLVIIRCWGAWRGDTKIMAVHRQYHHRVEAKRSQLLGVQQMFRNFASELESGLKGSLSSRGDMWERPKNIATKGPKYDGKSQGAVSLPDIRSGRSYGGIEGSSLSISAN
jgi:hypothetical protein